MKGGRALFIFAALLVSLLVVATASAKDVRLYVAGGNYQGQMGISGVESSPVFVQVPGLENLYSIASGGMFSMVLDADGVLRVAGLNSEGQFGLGHQNSCSTFTAVTYPANIKNMVAGAHHALVVDQNDEIWGSGYNYYGGLGTGDNWRRTSYTQVSSIASLEGIAAMNYSSVAWDTQGHVYTTGFNSLGELAQDDLNHRNTFQMAPFVLASAGTEIFGGGEHFVLLMYDGTIFVSGSNSSGQLGLGDNENRDVLTYVPSVGGIASAACGFSNTFIILNNGSVMATGRNSSSELGLGDAVDRDTFVAVPGLTGIVEMAAGSGHTLALKNDGTIWAAGANGNIGKLGIPKATTVSTFTQVPGLNFVQDIAAGTHHSMALALYGVEVVYPSDDDITLERNRKYEISWNSYNLPKKSKVRIELVKDDSEIWLLSAGASKSPFKWTVGKALKGHDMYPDGDGYKIRITTPNGDDVDESDFSFSIGSIRNLMITGDTDVVGGDAPTQYHAVAQYNYGEDQDVTSQAKWKTDLGKAAKIGKTGLLTTSTVTEDVTGNISATYKSKPPLTATKSVLIQHQD